MSFAYADPPYLGSAKRYANEHAEASAYDSVDAHRDLIDMLVVKYPDGWALSCSSTSLQTILAMCPQGIRIAAWVKPFAAFKRNVRNAYTWEPVIVSGGRMSSKDGAPVTRDHLAESITLVKGLCGAKPERFCIWVLAMLGYVPGDRVDDIFPGTGVMARVLRDSADGLDVARLRGRPTQDRGVVV